jgi:hypothetical protein
MAKPAVQTTDQMGGGTFVTQGSSMFGLMHDQPGIGTNICVYDTTPNGVVKAGLPQIAVADSGGKLLVQVPSESDPRKPVTLEIDAAIEAIRGHHKATDGDHDCCCHCHHHDHRDNSA